MVEFTNEAYALGIRRPYSEGHAFDDTVGGFEAARMCAQDLPQALMAALGEKMQVDIAESRQEAVCVGDGVWMGRTVGTGIVHFEPVVHQIGERQRDSEQAGFDVGERVALTADQRHYLDSVRPISANDGVVVVFVGTQNRMRVVVFTGQQAVEVGGVRPKVWARALVGLRHLFTPYAAN
jgi:hypothetical protein